jgi:hypothetical protein
MIMSSKKSCRFSSPDMKRKIADIHSGHFHNTNLFLYQRQFPISEAIRLTWPVLVDSKICSPGTTDVAMSLHRVATVSSRSLPWWPWLRVLLHSAPQKVSQKQKKLENFSLAQIKNLSRRRRALEPVPESRLGG